ncbi:hypothetical protein H4R35_004995, partial [Dimargaris xerosporica]
MSGPAIVNPGLLPLWRPRSPRSGIATITASFDGYVLRKAEASGVDGNSALITAWAVLVSRYVDTAQVAVGLLSGLNEDETHSNPVGLAIPVSTDSLVADVHSCVYSNIKHGQSAADDIVPVKRPFNALVVLGQSAALQENDPWLNAMQRQHCSLLIRHTAGQESCSIHLSYDRAVYADKAIQELAAQLSTLFTALLAALSATNDQASMRVQDVPWVSDRQRECLLELATVSVASKSGSPEPLGVSIQGLFTQWTAKNPDQAALIHGRNAMMYGELHHHASALAYELRSKHGVSCESRVAVFGQRSVEVSIAIMAVVYAGGAFVPIDSQLPSDRVAYILDDSQCAVVLTTSQDANRLPAHCTQSVVHVDELAGVLDGQPSPAINTQCTQSDLAYIIYTSGTTGRPKGVMVEYGCLENVVLRSALTQCFQPGQMCLQFFSVSFDAHLFVLFSALTHGCTLRIMRDEDALGDFQSVDVATVTPSFLARIDPLSCPKVQTVIVTGEACPQTLMDKWAKQCTLVNDYGPSETFTSHVQWLSAGRPVDIGKPVANVSSYVVDQNLQLVPLGVVGELLIGGIAPGRGYCNLPELTAERFLPNPFGPGRVYRTGDLVRWLPDGHLEYLGRRDSQVKLNGFRIELEEVESVAGQCSQVQQAAVIVHHNRLLCFVTPELSDFAPLVDHLRQILPHYMVPHTLVALAQFPTTVNGKVDRRALADLDLTSTAHCSLVADSTALDLATDIASDHAFNEKETVLRQAWAELLDMPLDRIARQAHFFQLGGDSIVAILLVSKCRQHGYQLTVPTVYAHPALASLARQLVPLHTTTANTALCAQTLVTGPVPLTPIQQWFFGLPLRNPHHFNQSFLIKLSQPVDATIIQDALVQLLTHHDMLRCRYTQHDNQWQQTIPTTEATHDDFGWAECHTTEAELSQHLAHLHTQLSLTKGPLFGALLIHLDTLPDQPRLYLVSHHVVIDLVSWRILIDDLNTLLTHQPLPSKTLSFTQWATSLEAHAATLSADCWPEQAATTDSVKPNTVNQVGTRRSIFHALDADTTDRLITHVCPVLRVTPRDAILSAYALAYCQTLSVPQVNLCMEGHGREPWLPDLDISRTVGWFTSFYPLVLHAQHNATLTAMLHQAKERLQQIPTKGFPYFVLKYMASVSAEERDKLLAKTPTHLDVLFNYFGRFTQSTSTHQFLVSIDWSDQYGEHDNPTEDWVPFDQYVMAMISGDALRLGINYNTRRCTNPAMTTLLATWATHLRELVQAFTADPLAISPVITRFDFDLLPLTASDFDQLSSQLTQRNLSWSQVEDLYPCTPLQSGLLLSTMRDPHAYLVQYHVTLTGDLDVHRLEVSWQQVALCHSILRTVFLEAPSQVITGFVQAVLKQSIVRFDADLAKAADELSTQAYQRLYTDFALDSPLLQVSVGALPNATNAHQMTVTFHHAMLDGWSFPLLVAEVLKCYHNVHSPALTSSSFRLVTQQILDARLSTAAAQFWQEYLAGAPQSPAPLLSPSADARTVGYSDYRTRLPFAKSTLLTFARRHGLSLSTLLRAAYALVLSRYLGTDQVVFGVTVAGRNLDVDNITTLIGPCLTTVPFRVTASDQPILTWLKQLHESYVRMIPYEQSNVADIAQWCQTPSHTPLFGTMMGFENQPPLAQDPAHALQAASVTFTEFTEYAFGVAFEELPDAILCKVGYANAWYDSNVGPRVAQHLAHVVEQLIAADHTLHLGSISLEPVEIDTDHVDGLVTSGEHSVALVDVLDAAASVASNAPGRIALQMADDSWTYSQLLASANKLAQCMDAVNSSDQQPLVVALVDDMGDLAVAVLASMTIRAHLVLVASQSPNRDIPALVHHVQPSLVLAPAATLSPHLPVSALAIHADITDSRPPVRKPRPHAYCFKLSMVDDTAASSVILKTVDCFSAALGNDCRSLVSIPDISTDGSLELLLWVLLRALHQGGSIQTLPSAANTNHPANAVEYQVLRPLMKLAKPSHIMVYFVGLADLMAFSPDPSLSDGTVVYVFHGTLFSTHASITVGEWRHSRWPTLRMARNAWQVVDRSDVVCPTGVIGRIKPAARSEPLHAMTSSKPNSLDGGHTCCPVLGLYSSQGALQLVGSLAHRMAINGVQWHPSSVLPVLSQLGWQNPVIQVLSSSEWVIMVSNTGFDVAHNTNQLAKHLPAHCPLPTVVSYAFFPHLPRIATDVPKLRAFVAGYALAKSTARGSADDIALWLTTLWHYLAYDHHQSVDDISSHGTFWDLGGTLADLIQLRHLINQRFSSALTMAELWNNTRFLSMVQLIHKMVNSSGQLEHQQTATRHTAVLCRTPLPISRLPIWYQAQLYAAAGSHYHQQTVQWPSTLSQSTVQTALDHVVASHDRCRVSFIEEHGTVYQRVHAGASVTTQVTSLDALKLADARAIKELAEWYHGEFDPQVPGLISVVLLTASPSSSEHCHAFLSVRIHPLIGDRSFVTHLVQKLLVACQLNGTKADDHAIDTLPALACAPEMADQRDETQPECIDYWASIFMDAPWHLDLPDDRTTLADPTWHFNTMSVDVMPCVHAGLAAYAKAQGANLMDIVGALVSLYVARITNQNEFLLGLLGSSDLGTLPSAPSAREPPYTLPLRIRSNPQSSLADLVDSFRANRMGAQDHYSEQAIAAAVARTKAQQVAVEQGLCRVALAVMDQCAAKAMMPDEYPN